jgi:hypothetical protein
MTDPVAGRRIPAGRGVAIAAGRRPRWTLAAQTDGRAQAILDMNPEPRIQKGHKHMFFTDANRSSSPSAPFAYDVAADPAVRGADPIELWDAWLFAAADAGLMLHAWLAAATSDKSWTHAGYLAALEREEHAARVLADRVAATSGSLSAS